MVEPISAGLSSLKTAFDLTKAILDVHGAVKIDAQVFQLQRLILEAQESQAALASQKRELEERVRELEAWDGEKERYELQTVGPNASLAYGLKPEAKEAEADHKLCANCYEHRRKSYLQPHTIPEGRARVLMCHVCESQILISGVADTRTVNSRKPPVRPTFGRP